MNKLPTINARDLLNYSKEELWRIPEDEFNLVFDDITIVTQVRPTIYSAYLWNIHRHYQHTPLYAHHHMQDGYMSNKQHLQLLENIYRDWFSTYANDNTVDIEDLWKLIYQTVNEIYNDFICRLDGYVSSLSGFDIMEAVFNDEVLQANQEVAPIQSSIDQTYDRITESLKNDASLKYNPIAMAVRAGTVDLKQVHQCIGPRGFVTEIDSTIYPQPITVGFAHSIRKLYDSMIESRSASKALMFAKDPLSECEYFNRRMQLVAQNLRDIVYTDCGSKHTLSWTIEPSELKVLEGMHYLDGDMLKTIQINDHHLVGQTVELRTVFGCQIEDRQSVCSTCYGQNAYSIPRQTSVGQVAATALGEKISQLVLSIKHVDGSSKVEDIELDPMYYSYVVPGSENSTLRLSPELHGLPVKIVVNAHEAKDLPGIYRMDLDQDIDITSFTEMRDVKFLIGDENRDEQHEIRVPVSMGSRYGSLTANALRYIQNHRPSLDQYGNYVIDLTDWNPDYALFKLPLKHANMIDFQKRVERALFSSSKESKRDSLALARYKNAATPAVKDLLALINQSLSINVSHVLVMAYVMTARSPREFDYRLPIGGESFEFVELKKIMEYRSLGVKMAYESQEEVMGMPESYVFKDRPSHPLDELLLSSYS